MRSLVGAARRTGYPAAQLTPLLGETLLPLLRTRHPGPAGDWLWERLVVWAREDYAAASAGAPAATATREAVDTVRAPTPDANPVVYRLDPRDVITRVNTAWRAFAIENGAPSLAAHVVGTSFWAYVDGAATRELYRRVHAAVRRSGRPVTLPFRCDAPDEWRWMELTVRPLGAGHLQVMSAVVRRATRPWVALLDPAMPRGAGQLVMCSWCKRVRLGDDGSAATAGHDAARDDDRAPPWVDVESLPAARQGSGAPHVVHDVCPDCAADVHAALTTA